jgi:hypothetical protein
MNSFYLNTSQAQIDEMNPVTEDNLDKFIDFFISKNEFLQLKEFDFFYSLSIKFFYSETKNEKGGEFIFYWFKRTYIKFMLFAKR